MKWNWKMVGLQTLLAGALAVAPVGATEGPEAEPAKEDPVARQLKELKASVDTLIKLQKAQADIEEIQKQITQLRKDLDELRKQPPASQVTKSFAIQPNGTGYVRVRMVNSYVDEVSIIVNGRAYRLVPGESRYTESLPAGTITYEVLGVQALRKVALAANEPFTIEVYDRTRR